MLVEAGKRYGEGIIKEYSKKLKADVGKQYTERTLRRFRQFYNLYVEAKWSTLSTKLSWSHYSELLSISNIDKINYYIKLVEEQNLSIRELRTKIKNDEYERLDENTKLKLINKEESKIENFIKNPIIINNRNNYEIISEKILQKLVIEDIENFMKELGRGYTFTALTIMKKFIY